MGCRQSIVAAANDLHYKIKRAPRFAAGTRRMVNELKSFAKSVDIFYFP